MCMWDSCLSVGNNLTHFMVNYIKYNKISKCIQQLYYSNGFTKFLEKFD